MYCIAQKKYRSAYAKFRCGVAPIKIETGRYGVNRVPPEARLCMQCTIESKMNFMLLCNAHCMLCICVEIII